MCLLSSGGSVGECCQSRCSTTLAVGTLVDAVTLEVALVNAVSHGALLVHCTLAVSTLEDAVLWRSRIRHVAARVCCTLAVSTLAGAVLWR